MKFRNPANGYVDDISSASGWAFLFGVFYFMAKGIWGHAFVWLILAIIFALMGPFGWFLIFVMQISYAYAADGILKSAYLRKGWTEVSERQPFDAPSAYRKCPLCAEEIKAEAVKCKHCGSAVEAQS